MAKKRVESFRRQHGRKTVTCQTDFPLTPSHLLPRRSQHLGATSGTYVPSTTVTIL